MNIGIQDGVEAGRVVGRALLEGRTGETDLGQYELIRKPVAEGVVALTHRITTMGTIERPWVCLVRNWILWGVINLPFVKGYMVHRLAELQ